MSLRMSGRRVALALRASGATYARVAAHPKGQATTRGCDWRDLAECRNEDPELFFPVGTGAAADAQTAQAKEVCYRCPAATDCLAWAMDTGQASGIWGGLSEDDRRDLRRKMGW